MYVIVAKNAQHLQSGDVLIGMEDAMAGIAHFPVHAVADIDGNTEVTFLHGEKIVIGAVDSILALQHAEGEVVLVEVEDPRERPDLIEAAEAQARVERGEDYFGLAPHPAEVSLDAALARIATLEALLGQLQEQEKSE